MMIKKLGDGCAADFRDITVKSDGFDEMYDTGSKADGTVIRLDSVTLPQTVLDMIEEKLGDGCNISVENCTIE